MDWNPTPLLVAATFVGGVAASAFFGEWVENRFNIDGFITSVGSAILLFGIVVGFVVPA